MVPLVTTSHDLHPPSLRPSPLVVTVHSVCTCLTVASHPSSHPCPTLSTLPLLNIYWFSSMAGLLILIVHHPLRGSTVPSFPLLHLLHCTSSSLCGFTESSFVSVAHTLDSVRSLSPRRYTSFPPSLAARSIASIARYRRLL